MNLGKNIFEKKRIRIYLFGKILIEWREKVLLQISKVRVIKMTSNDIILIRFNLFNITWTLRTYKVYDWYYAEVKEYYFKQLD